MAKTESKKENKTEITYTDVVRDVRNGQFKPIYYLMGEESYYTDKTADFIVNEVLTEDQRDFNLSVFYGSDSSIGDILMAAKRFPMMSDYQVVLVKEAQQLSSLEGLAEYLEHPQKQTLLVFCHKNGSLDSRKTVTKAIASSGVLLESKKLKEVQLRQFVHQYVQRKNLSIDEKSAELLAENVGSDLNRLSSEIEKLILTMPQGQTRITPQQIETNIGISKEYNNYELRSAIVAKDVLKVNRIANYFDKNPKSNPLQVTLASLFSYFSNLMLAHYAPVKTEQGVADMLGFRSTWQSRDYLVGMKMYSARKTMDIIAAIRLADAKSKGVGNKSATPGQILQELLFFVLH